MSVLGRHTDKAPAAELAARLEPRRVVVVTGACIAVLSVLGIAEALGADLRRFALDGERTVPALFSGAALLGAAALALACAQVSRRPGVSAAFLVFAATLAYMGVDEGLALHEKAERQTGVVWQMLYVPLIAAVCVSGLVVLEVLWKWRPDAGKVFFAGAAAWAVSQLLEDLQWDRPSDLVHPWMIVPEEILEMAGTVCLAIGLLLWLRAAVRAD